MRVTNMISGVRLVGQWTYDESTIVVTDRYGNEFVIQAGEVGGLCIMTCDGEPITVAPVTRNAVELRGSP
jgi:hypothetical protein